jgi:hypothetical protein
VDAGSVLTKQLGDIRADCRPSLQVRNRKGSAKKSDAQGISQIFCCANAANGGSEPLADPFLTAEKYFGGWKAIILYQFSKLLQCDGNWLAKPLQPAQFGVESNSALRMTSSLRIQCHSTSRHLPTETRQCLFVSCTTTNTEISMLKKFHFIFLSSSSICESITYVTSNFFATFLRYLFARYLPILRCSRAFLYGYRLPAPTVFSVFTDRIWWVFTRSSNYSFNDALRDTQHEFVLWAMLSQFFCSVFGSD